jgi:hypothetical protein
MRLGLPKEYGAAGSLAAVLSSEGVPGGRPNTGYVTGEDRRLSGCTNLELGKSSSARKGREKKWPKNV